MNIVEGKFYKNRQGFKVGPMVLGSNPNALWPWSGKWIGEENQPLAATFTNTGRAGYNIEDDHPNDVISLWDEEEVIPKQIDQLSYLDFRKGIDKLWKMGRAF